LGGKTYFVPPLKNPFGFPPTPKFSFPKKREMGQGGAPPKKNGGGRGAFFFLRFLLGVFFSPKIFFGVGRGGRGAPGPFGGKRGGVPGGARPFGGGGPGGGKKTKNPGGFPPPDPAPGKWFDFFFLWGGEKKISFFFFFFFFFFHFFFPGPHFWV